MESVRIGTIIAQDRRALAKWRSHVARITPASGRPQGVTGSHGGGLAGAELEQVVMALRITNPDIVGVRIRPA